PADVNAQKKFEGKVNIKVTQDDESSIIEYYLKDNKMRFEMGEEISQFSIIDMAGKKIYMVIPADEIYMEVPAQGMFTAVEQNNSEVGLNRIQPTGEAKEINGYLCEKWVYNGDEGITESWLAIDLGGFLFMDNPMGGGSKSGWQSEIESSGYFPMLIINRNNDGEEKSRYEVTSIEQESLSADLFTPPAGYQKMEMPGMDMFK
ncbi:MAG: DUF4412 domain-containing protein, partial [Ignavibacteriaceae bacterium]